LFFLFSILLALRQVLCLYKSSSHQNKEKEREKGKLDQTMAQTEDIALQYHSQAPNTTTSGEDDYEQDALSNIDRGPSSSNNINKNGQWTMNRKQVSVLVGSAILQLPIWGKSLPVNTYFYQYFYSSQTVIPLIILELQD